MAKKLKYEPFNWKGLTPNPVIGVDEAGRGCLAGPVCAGAVILQSEIGLQDFKDSKLLSEKRREELFDVILAHHRVGIGFATVEEIERLNILNAAFLAMRRAIEDLGVSKGHVIVDGHIKIRELNTAFLQTPLVKGDLRAAPVAAASIIAKVSRDRLMVELSKEFPEYGFEKHKGYSTEDHKKALQIHGPIIHHRKTFGGVKELIISG